MSVRVTLARLGPGRPRLSARRCCARERRPALLKHLPEYHPAAMAPLFRAELRLGDPRFAAAVASCWNFGSGRTVRQIQRILDEAKNLRSDGPFRPATRARKRAIGKGRSDSARR